MNVRAVDMAPRGPEPARLAAAPVGAAQARVNLALDGQVQKALNLALTLKNPTQMPAVLAALKAAAPTVQEALDSLHYVHFARFLPSRDGTTLWVITSYDGGLDAYIMDFVAVLGDVFTDVLMYVQGAPRLPVQRYPRDFVDFVKANNVPIGVWSAYPDMTVIDIQRAAARP